MSNNIDIVSAAKSAYAPGTILGQIVQFEDGGPYNPYGVTKRVDKVSLNFVVNTIGRKDYIEESNGIAAFSASNFQESRDSWVFQPTIHWQLGNTWQTSGTPIKNTLQTESYGSAEDAVTNAPQIKYETLFSTTGNYTIWGYGFTAGGDTYWSFEDDTTDLYSFYLGDQSGYYGIPMWTQIGSIYIEEGGTYNFSIYLGSASIVILDQLCFVHSTLGNIFEGKYFEPLSNSIAPFNTVVRLRSLSYNNSVDSLDSPTSIYPRSISSWLPSKYIIASGKYNYEIVSTDFVGGLTIEYWQVGGNENHFAAWQYAFPDNSVGRSFISSDWGESFEI